MISTDHRLGAALIWTLALAMLFGCQRVEDSRIELTDSQRDQIEAHLLDQSPDPDERLEVEFGNEIELVGVDIDGEFVHGEEVELIWYWRALEDIDDDWQIFVHFDSDQNRYRQNLDHYPLAAEMDDVYRTYHWEEGQVIADAHPFVVSGDYPQGEATFYVGLFRGDQRSPVTNDGPATEGNRAIGPTVEIADRGGQ